LSDVVDRLRNLTPIQAGAVMVFVTLFVPFLVTISGSWGSQGVNINGFNYVATLWGIGPIGSPDSQFQVFLSYTIIISLIFSAPNIVFSGQIIRYLMGKTSYRRTIVFGILGILFPFILTFNMMIALLQMGYPNYLGPLPFQLITGLILMKYPGPPTETPWESEKSRGEWWSG
jgi:hypothetical protein